MKEKISLLLLEKRRHELKQKVTLLEKYKLWKNVPIQKIIGFIEMANVKIKINNKVLIPRYETEELIYHAIDQIKKNNYHSVLDLCCGSGFIGIALKKNNENLDIVQSDIDPIAIKQTKINMKLNNLNNITVKSDMFNNIENKFDIIVSNPPYLSFQEKDNMDKSVLKYEPHHSLFANNNGLEFYEIIENNLTKFINQNGMILVEINPINVQWFISKNYQIIKDINNKDRFAWKKI